MVPARKCDTILSLPLKIFCGFRVRMKRKKKNKHIMKFKPHQEQKKKRKNHRAVFLWVTFNFIKTQSGKEPV